MLCIYILFWTLTVTFADHKSVVIDQLFPQKKRQTETKLKIHVYIAQTPNVLVFLVLEFKEHILICC